MERFIAALILAQAGSACWAAQNPTEQVPVFEAASVKPADPAVRASGKSGGPGTRDPGRVRFGKVTLMDLLGTAFNVQQDQLSGPSWMGDPMGPDKYDVVATMAPGTTVEQFRTMLQNLLIDRFDLSFHHETKPAPGYNLVVGKNGPRFTEVTPNLTADDSPEPLRPKMGKDGWPTLPPGAHSIRFVAGGREKVMCQEESMADFAERLGPMIGNSVGRLKSGGWPRVIDKTGLQGKYTFRLEYACARCQVRQSDAGSPSQGSGAEGPSGIDPSGVPDIFGALDKQLGLNLQKAGDVPVDMLVIDRASKVPKAN